MNHIHYRLHLDMFETVSQKTIKAKKGDTACSIHITLTERGKIYHIPDDCRATFTARKPDGNFLYNEETCRIENNTIVYDFTKQTTACEGNVECEVILYKGDMQLTSPLFTLFVDATVYNGEEIISSPEADALKQIVEDANKAFSDITEQMWMLCGALRGTKSGEVIKITDTSPFEHNVGVKVSGVDDLTAVRVKRLGKNIVNIPNIDKDTSVGTNSVSIPCYITEAINISGVNDNAVIQDSTGATRSVWRIQVVYADGTNGTMSDHQFPSWNFNASVSNPIVEIRYRAVYIVSGQYKDIQVEYGTVATAYEPYIDPTIYTPNADGTVEGVTSLYPNMTLTTDTSGVVIDAEYNRDINKAFEELKQAIINLGGNV